MIFISAGVAGFVVSNASGVLFTIGASGAVFGPLGAPSSDTAGIAAAPSAAYTAEAEHRDRSIVNAPIGDRDRSGPTLAGRSGGYVTKRVASASLRKELAAGGTDRSVEV